MLSRSTGLDGKDAIQRKLGGVSENKTDHDEHYQALEVQSPSVARTAVPRLGGWQSWTGLLDQDGLTELGQRGCGTARQMLRTHWQWASVTA